VVGAGATAAILAGVAVSRAGNANTSAQEAIAAANAATAAANTANATAASSLSAAQAAAASSAQALLLAECTYDIAATGSDTSPIDLAGKGVVCP